jgi:hypothetical protein
MPTVETQQIFATPPSRSSAPDSITIGAGSIWVDYGDGVSSTGGGHSTIVQYDMRGQVQHTWTVDGLADGLKYDPRTGDVWVLNNNDGNANLQLINPATGQLSTPLAYAAPYVYGRIPRAGMTTWCSEARTCSSAIPTPSIPAIR